MSNSNKAIFLILTAFSFLLISMNFNSTNQTISAYADKPERSSLILYGEELFRRENCIQCHTLRIENATSERISLDGYGGRRSSAWIYQLFLDPRAVIYGVDDHDFAHLIEIDLKKSSLIDILRANDPSLKMGIDEEWLNLITEADSLHSSFPEYYTDIKNRTEVFAMMAFLQHIPSTAEKKRIDSIAVVKFQKELDALNEIYKNSDSLMQAALADPNSIEKGKRLFRPNCAVCHGSNGQGGIGPNLTDDYWIYGGSTSDVINTIVEGSSNGKMPNNKHRLNPTEVAEIVSYLISIKGTNHPGSSPQGNKE